jgi:SPP1 gp7 family putative phage head morphogenesis protein
MADLQALQARLDLPPATAIAYLRGKGLLLTWNWFDAWQGAHTGAFTVAKVTTQDVLQTIRDAVQRAIEDGQTFEQFQRDLTPLLQEMGWWGKQEQLDASTGEVTTVQLGSAARLRTIFQTNAQTTYMVGRYQAQVENASDRPFWQYVAVMDGRTRPAHAALHGRIWRFDDAAWRVIYPPNGWGCRCRVRALTADQVKGQRIENGADATTEHEVTIGKDGQKATVQGVRFTDAAGRNRVFWPDPGWDYNPGQSYQAHLQALLQAKQSGGTNGQ